MARRAFKIDSEEVHELRSQPPEGWRNVKLGDLVSPSKEKIEPAQCPDAPYLSLEHIESGTNRIVGQGRASDVKSTKTVFRAGDILYGKLRPYLNKVAVPGFDGVCSTDILVFPKTSAVDSRLLMWFLSQPEVVRFANHHSSGIELPRTNFKSLAILDFPLPPEKEQQRLVAAIQSFRARARSSVQRLERVEQLLDRFRQSVLAAARSGRLTRDWRERRHPIGSDQNLLNRIQGCFTELSFDFRPKDPLPETWIYAPLAAVGEWFSGGTPSKSKPEYWNGGSVPWISPKDMKTDFLNDSQDHLSVSALEKTRIRLVPPRTLLFVVRGLILAHSFPVALTMCEATFNQDIKAIQVHSEISAEFILRILHAETPDILSAVKSSTHGTRRLETAILKSWPVPVPPLEEQKEIVRRVDALFKFADSIEKKVKNAKGRAEKLSQAILAKAFRGELVPTEAELARQEGRVYESAAELLERINGFGKGSFT